MEVYFWKMCWFLLCLICHDICLQMLCLCMGFFLWMGGGLICFWKCNQVSYFSFFNFKTKTLLTKLLVLLLEMDQNLRAESDRMKSTIPNLIFSIQLTRIMPTINTRLKNLKKAKVWDKIDIQEWINVLVFYSHRFDPCLYHLVWQIN